MIGNKTPCLKGWIYTYFDFSLIDWGEPNVLLSTGKSQSDPNRHEQRLRAPIQRSDIPDPSCEVILGDNLFCLRQFNYFKVRTIQFDHHQRTSLDVFNDDLSPTQHVIQPLRDVCLDVSGDSNLYLLRLSLRQFFGCLNSHLAAVEML